MWDIGCRVEDTDIKIAKHETMADKDSSRVRKDFLELIETWNLYQNSEKILNTVPKGSLRLVNTLLRHHSDF